MRYIIFMKDDCPYCVNAVELLKSKGLDYHSIVFRSDQNDILSEVKDAYQWSTVPIIVSREGDHIKLIGGYTDLVEHVKYE